eukprot:c13678_g1_i1.p1 GENE.c13678_g1_i1~~c13678_g1_i1.p1  ORF type:complete len:345 (-),score=148.77 c13678_g1_i1:52-1086(-)
MDKLTALVGNVTLDDDDLGTTRKDDVIYRAKLWKVRHSLATVEWKQRDAVLYQTHISYYKSSKDKEGTTVELDGVSMIMNPSNSDCPKREFSFALIHPKRKNVYLAANNQEEMDSWQKYILSVGVKLSANPGENLPPRRVTAGIKASGNAPAKLTLRTRLEKYVASKAMNTKAGVEIIETFFGDSGVETLEVLNAFVASQSDEETAEKIEKNILRMAAKIAVLIKNGVITDEQLVPIIPTTLAWCKSFISVYGSYGSGNKQLQSKEEHIAALIKNGWAIEEWLQSLIKPHLRDTSAERVKTVFQFFLDEEVLVSLLSTENQETAQILLDDVLDLYHKINEGQTE